MDADPKDPRWERAFLDLAHGLVMAAAKPKLVSHLTQMPMRRVREINLALLGRRGSSGPITPAAPAFFVVPGSRTSSNWSIQGAAYLACYEDIEELTGMRLHRGWRMLAAYRCYLWSTEPIPGQRRYRRLDINQAYALLSHCQFLESRDAQIQRRRCARCMLQYLVLKHAPSARQSCPVCTIDAHHENRVDQAGRTKARRRG